MPDGRLETLLRPDEKPVGNGMPVSKAVRSCRPESPLKSVGKGRDGMEKGKEKGSGGLEGELQVGNWSPRRYSCIQCYEIELGNHAQRTEG